MDDELDELELEQRSIASVDAAERHSKRGISAEREFAWPVSEAARKGN